MCDASLIKILTAISLFVVIIISIILTGLWYKEQQGEEDKWIWEDSDE